MALEISEFNCYDERQPANKSSRVQNIDTAQKLWKEGAKLLLSGDVHQAIRRFDESLEIKPTAEGYTYRGWAISRLGRVDEAIDECKKAIQLDPNFGNSYNDIGVYLLRKVGAEKAIPWFERAKRARRYGARHYPCLNLGRIYLARGEKMRALDEFLDGLAYRPGNCELLAAIASVEYSVN